MGCPLTIDTPTSNDFTATFVGLDGSGKSKIVFRLTKTDAPSEYLALPTPGVAYSAFLQEKTTVRIYDCGGLGRYREQWGYYIQQSDAVVFVIDRTDKHRLERACVELAEVAGKCKAKRIPLLVAINKTDLTTKPTTQEVLKITNADQGEPEYQITECSAETNTGVQSTRDWLLSRVDQKHRRPQ
jgi:small GTP-binding protein